MGLIESCQLPGPTPESPTVTLLRISTKHQVYLIRNQVHTVWLQAHAITLPAFTSRIQTAARKGKQAFHRPSPKLLKDIILMGGADVKCSNLTLVTLATAKQALQALDMPDFIVMAAQSLKDAQHLVLHSPAAVLRQQNAPIALQPVQLHMDVNLPSSLDPCPPILKVRERYSLNQHPTLSRTSLLQMQMKEFKAWCTRDFQADRGYDSVQRITWEQAEKEVMLLLGFAHYKKNWAQPGLAVACNASLLSSYIAARKLRGDSWSTALKIFSTTLKVTAWLQSKPSLAPGQVQQLASVRQWLGDMRSQLSRVWHNVVRDPVTMHEEGKWMHARDLVCLFEKHRAGVMEAFASASRVLSPKQARYVHDVTMCCCMFGWMPPLRLYCVRSMAAPAAAMVCPEEGCSTSARPCVGNRVMFTPSGSLCFHLPHHKNAMKWGKLAIQFDVPLGLLQLLQLYLDQARPVLLADCEVSLPQLFFTTTGLRFSSARFCQYFKEIMHSMGAPAIAPKDLRHIFVVDRCDDKTAPGPVNAGAAMVMGHSERAWASVYDLKYNRRMADAAVSAMGDWRAYHLREQGASGTSPSVPCSDVERTFVHVEGMPGVDDEEEGGDGDESDEEMLAFAQSEPVRDDGDQSDEEIQPFARSQPVRHPRCVSSSPEAEDEIQIDLAE